MKFRFTLEPPSNPMTFTVEGWECLKENIEALEADGKRWLVGKA